MSDGNGVPKKRIHLGSRADLGTRTRIYLGPEGIEIDEHTGFASGRRRRVLFDEVQLITLDRRRNKVWLWTAAALGLGVALFMFLLMSAERDTGPGVATGVTLGLTWPFWLFIAIHWGFGTDYVTVFGKRSLAQMTFALRKQRARDVFDRLRTAVAESTAAAGLH